MASPSHEGLIICLMADNRSLDISQSDLSGDVQTQTKTPQVTHVIDCFQA